jgi:hypothetical protein
VETLQTHASPLRCPKGRTGGRMLLSARGDRRSGDGPFQCGFPARGIRHQVIGASHVPAASVPFLPVRSTSPHR